MQISEKRPKSKPAAASSAALQGFDALPNSAHVKVTVVAGLAGCVVSTVWDRAKKGVLPKPVKIGGSTVWRVGELRSALGLTEARAQ